MAASLDKRAFNRDKQAEELHRSSSRLATELEIRASVAGVRAALAHTEWQQPNIWVFYSNKNQELLTILGDVAFIQAVLLEGQPRVLQYSLSRVDHLTKIHAIDANQKSIIYLCSSAARSATDEVGDSDVKQVADANVKTIRLTAQSQSPRMVEFTNWLMLCGAMTRAKNFSTEREANALVERLNVGAALTISDALAIPNLDPALVLSALAKGLAAGVFQCELKSNLLEVATQIRLATQSKGVEPDVVVHRTADHAEAYAPRMPLNRRTRGHPELFSDPANWLSTDASCIAINSELGLRRKAIHMYLHGASYEAILRETGFSDSWVRKLFLRTLKSDSDDKPFGIDGLEKYRHIVQYTRTRALPVGNLEEGARGGYAGAMGQLFERYPDDLMAIVEAEVLKQRALLLDHDGKSNGKSRKSTIPKARASWVDLHLEVISFLKEKGIASNEYPLNTRDQGYSSIARLGNSLLLHKPNKWIEHRAGNEAARRARIGHGFTPLITSRWALQILELDFHKEDSAATVEIPTPKGTMLDVPVSRWWLGGVFDEFTQAAISTSDSFEPQTTQDCVLELLDSAVCPPDAILRLDRLRNGKGGVWQPNQLLPPLRFQGWDVLKMDRAWAHKSTNVIAALIGTVGCAICFGAPRHWWQRWLVEHGFGKITQAGSQQLPSTYGTNPKDARRKDPEAQAQKYRIRQDDICDLMKAVARWLNESENEGVFFSSPFALLKDVIENPAGRFFPRPLPLAFRKDRPTMWHTIDCHIEGSGKRGIAPCVRTNRTRFRGHQLAKAWGLVGSPVVLQVQWRDIRKGRLLSVPSGRFIDVVTPEQKWMQLPLRWNDFVLIQKFGLISKRIGRSTSPACDFLKQKADEIAHKAKAKNSHKDAKRAAGQYAKVKRSTEDRDCSRVAQANDADQGNQVEPSGPNIDACNKGREINLAPAIGSFARRGWRR